MRTWQLSIREAPEKELWYLVSNKYPSEYFPSADLEMVEISEYEKLKKENEVLRSNLEAIGAGTGETSWTDKLIADSAIEQANKIREGK